MEAAMLARGHRSPGRLGGAVQEVQVAPSAESARRTTTVLSRLSRISCGGPRGPQARAPASVTGRAAGRSGRGADAGAEVEDVRPDRVGLHGRRCRPVENRLERKLARMANDPDRSGLGDLSLQPMAFAAVFTGDGHSHCFSSVAPRVLRTTPPTVASRIPPGNKSPISAPDASDAPAEPAQRGSRPWTRLSATLGEIAFGTGARARHSHHRDRSAGPPAPFPTRRTRPAGRRLGRHCRASWESAEGEG